VSRNENGAEKDETKLMLFLFLYFYAEVEINIEILKTTNMKTNTSRKIDGTNTV
jgi:hypothetical protein